VGPAETIQLLVAALRGELAPSLSA
jgi:hypothetical protein